ncbi:MAG: hypothetical protein U1E70_16510 [Acetobacteraceae bacterium]|nr:hypothetical protein [Pseudomonadota bacterium]
MTNDVARARRIMGGLAATDAADPATHIGYALADMTVKDFDAAIVRLRPLADGGDTAATVMLGVALKLGGRAGEYDALMARLPPGDAARAALADGLR